MRTVNQTREQRIAQLTAQRDQMQTRAMSYVELAEVILRTPASKNSYGRHWRAVARVLKEDAVRLTQKAEKIEGRISDLERAKDAAENWTPPPTVPEAGPTDLEILFRDDEDEQWGAV